MTTNRDQAARRQVLSDLTRPEYIDDYDQGLILQLANELDRSDLYTIDAAVEWLRAKAAQS